MFQYRNEKPMTAPSSHDILDGANSAEMGGCRTMHYSPTLGIYMHNGDVDVDVDARSSPASCTTGKCSSSEPNFSNVYPSARNGIQNASSCCYHSNIHNASNANANANANVVVPTVLRPNAGGVGAINACHHIVGLQVLQIRDGNAGASGLPQYRTQDVKFVPAPSSHSPHYHHRVRHSHVAASRGSRMMQHKHCNFSRHGLGRRLRNEKYKTELCVDFMYGRCRRGRDRCHFAHGENDLMPLGASSQMMMMQGDDYYYDRSSFQLCSDARAFVPASAVVRPAQSIAVSNNFKDAHVAGRQEPMLCREAETAMSRRNDRSADQSAAFNMFAAAPPQMPSNIFFESIDQASTSSKDDELALPRPASSSSSSTVPSNPWSLNGASSDCSRQWSPVIGPPKQPPEFSEKSEGTGKTKSTSPSGVDADLEEDEYLSMLSELHCLDLV